MCLLGGRRRELEVVVVPVVTRSYCSPGRERSRRVDRGVGIGGREGVRRSPGGEGSYRVEGVVVDIMSRRGGLSGGVGESRPLEVVRLSVLQRLLVVRRPSVSR